MLADLCKCQQKTIENNTEITILSRKISDKSKRIMESFHNVSFVRKSTSSFAYDGMTYEMTVSNHMGAWVMCIVDYTLNIANISNS